MKKVYLIRMAKTKFQTSFDVCECFFGDEIALCDYLHKYNLDDYAIKYFD